MLSLRAPGSVGRSPYVRAAVTPGFHLGVPRAGRKGLGGGGVGHWPGRGSASKSTLMPAPPQTTPLTLPKRYKWNRGK